VAGSRGRYSQYVLTLLLVRVLYEPTLFDNIVREAAAPDGIFDARDWIGLVSDALALGRARRAASSRVLVLAHVLKDTRNCKLPISHPHIPSNRDRAGDVLDGIAGALTTLVATWHAHARISTGLRLLQQVRARRAASRATRS
jgi:hypothetical protein